MGIGIGKVLPITLVLTMVEDEKGVFGRRFHRSTERTETQTSVTNN